MRTSRPRVRALPAAFGLLVIAALAVVSTSIARAADDDGAAYVDQLIEQAWEDASIKPSPACSDAEYLRRIYLDILGRIPTVQEAEAFLSSKESGKRAKLVEYLLENPDYPKNLGNLWSNLLVGRKPQERRVDRDALSNWLRLQFAANRPWNEIANELVTASGSNKENGAVNYTLAHLDNGATSLTSYTTRLFLGQQIQCTQCHDHPYNEWKQKDFWGINAFFLGVRKEEVERTDATGAEVYDHTEVTDQPTAEFASYEKRNAYREIAFPMYLDGRLVGQGSEVERRKELGKFITGEDNDQFARAFVNRMWGHFMGRGFVQPVDDFGPHNPASHPELLDKLSQDFKASHYDIKGLIRKIANSKPYHLSSVMTKANEKDDVLFSHMALKPLSPEQLFDSLLVATQAHKTAGPEMDKKRRQWLAPFVNTFANDEQGESTNFQGTIPQALMMMNGDMMQQATGGRPGSFLAKLLDEARRGRRSPELFVVNRLYLAALTRRPTQSELARAQAFMTSGPDTIAIIEDMFWSLLNSNEFVLNH